MTAPILSADALVRAVGAAAQQLDRPFVTDVVPARSWTELMWPER